jgi:hypothetical protein
MSFISWTLCQICIWIYSGGGKREVHETFEGDASYKSLWTPEIEVKSEKGVDRYVSNINHIVPSRRKIQQFQEETSNNLDLEQDTHDDKDVES